MFFSRLAQFGSAIALVQGDTRLSYQALADRVEALSASLPEQKSLIIIRANNDIASIVSYLAVLRGGHVAMLVAPTLSEPALQKLVSGFCPAALWHGDDRQVLHSSPYPVDKRLGLLLSTSGSTGSPKQVALSYQNLEANAEAINQYLPIRPDQRALANLPIHYSYGLSVVNSHLKAGATLVLSEASVISRDFWQLMEREKINSVAGVPSSYEMLIRLGLCNKSLPHLEYVTQAGGALAPERVTQIAQWADKHDKQCFIMYGQTEATARMAYHGLPGLLTKPASIGRAIPGGTLRLVDANDQDIHTPLQQGQLVYQGPNVMLGYVTGAGQLAAFEPLTSLTTGDLAYMDVDGDFFICGRKSRFVKLSGMRLDLDEIQRQLQQAGISAVVTGTDAGIAVLALESNPKVPETLKGLAAQLGIHHSLVKVKLAPTLPMTTSGKTDYAKAASMVCGEVRK